LQLLAELDIMLVFLVPGVEQEGCQKKLEGEEEVEDATEIDYEVLSAIDEDCGVNGCLRVTLGVEGVGEVVGYEPKLVMAEASQHVVEIKVKGEVADPRKAEYLDHADQTQALGVKPGVPKEDGGAEEKQAEEDEDDALSLEVAVF
jgi:hypothetical protein